MHGYRCLFIAIFAACALLSACTTFGPKKLPTDRFNYNHAIAYSWHEQLLLNLVRLRYLEEPTFLDVSSVVTQYTYSGNLGVQGSAGKNEGWLDDVAGGNIGIGYSERPTITFTPMTGEEISRRLLKPIPIDLLFGLAQSSWPIDQLIPVSLQRLNHLKNMSFALLPKPHDLERLRTFQRVTYLLQALLEVGAVELQGAEGEVLGRRFLVFEPDQNLGTQALIDELKHILRLDPQLNVFRVTLRLTRREPDEISFQTRSVLAIMFFLSHGIEIPQAHLSDGRAAVLTSVEDEDLYDIFFPLRVHTQPDRPEDVFVAVRYQRHWFYIAHADIESKRAFGVLSSLFRLQAPPSASTAPILTLPAGP